MYKNIVINLKSETKTMQIPKYVESFRKDLDLKNYALSTIENYTSQISVFLNHFDGIFTEPAKINEQSIKEWLLLAQKVNSRKHRLSALKLFYKHTIKQPMKLKYIEYPRSEKKLPIVLSQDEIQRMFDVLFLMFYVQLYCELIYIFGL